MSLPLEPTPILDEEGTVWLFQRMKYWETHKRPPRDLEINMDDINDAIAQDRADREAAAEKQSAELEKGEDVPKSI